MNFIPPINPTINSNPLTPLSYTNDRVHHLTFTVLIPTYRRPIDLQRCLDALKQQTHLPEAVLLIVRDHDIDTWTMLSQYDRETLPLKTVTIQQPGVVAALNLGLDHIQTHAQTDIIAITDDDAAPHVDWLQRLEACYLTDRSIAGVGGRDWVYHGRELEAGTAATVGRLQWFGRLLGNHHIGVGEARSVDILKGVNMSFRRTAIASLRFDGTMRGTGAQVHFEIPFCLTLKQQGWTLIYDPQIGVDHFRGERFDEDQRDRFNAVAVMNAVHNETLAILPYLSPVQRIIFGLWSVLIGTREAYGLVQWLRFLPSGVAGRKWRATLQGRWQGWRSWRDRINLNR